MVHACYAEFLKHFKPSDPKQLFKEGGAEWQKYKKEHAAEIAKLPKSACKPKHSRRKKKGSRKNDGKKIRGSRKIKKLLLTEGDFDAKAIAEIKRLL